MGNVLCRSEAWSFVWKWGVRNIKNLGGMPPLSSTYILWLLTWDGRRSALISSSFRLFFSWSRSWSQRSSLIGAELLDSMEESAERYSFSRYDCGSLFQPHCGWWENMAMKCLQGICQRTQSLQVHCGMLLSPINCTICVLPEGLRTLKVPAVVMVIDSFLNLATFWILERQWSTTFLGRPLK